MPQTNLERQADPRIAKLQLEILALEWELIQKKKVVALEKYQFLLLRCCAATYKKEAAQKDVETARHAMDGWEEEQPEPDEILDAKREELAREGQLDLHAEAELRALHYPMWEDWAAWALERKARMELHARLPKLQAIYEDSKQEEAQAVSDVHAFFPQLKQAVTQATDYESLQLLMQKTNVPAETAAQALGLSPGDAQSILACLERTRRTVRHLRSPQST